MKFQPAFLTGFRGEATQTSVDTRRATEGPADVLDSTSRSPTERNAVDMPRIRRRSRKHVRNAD